MANAIKEIEKVNMEVEKHYSTGGAAQFIKPMNLKPKPSTSAQKKRNPPSTMILSQSTTTSLSKTPESKQTVKSYKHEVFKDDQDKSRVSIVLEATPPIEVNKSIAQYTPEKSEQLDDS